MMKEELEKRLHNIAELLYEQGFDDGKAKGSNDAMQKIKKYEERQKQDATDIDDGSIKVGDEG